MTRVLIYGRRPAIGNFEIFRSEGLTYRLRLPILLLSADRLATEQPQTTEPMTATIPLPSWAADASPIDTRAKLAAALKPLGYRIAGTRRYQNRLNAEHYPATEVTVRDIETGGSPFHFEARRDARFEAFQKLRRDRTIIIRGRVWEM